MIFVFRKIQIRKLMNESAYNERRLEAPSASSVDQPPKMVNLFLSPMKNVNSQRIDRNLDGLRHRYGVSNDCTTKSKITAIRVDPKVTSNLTLLQAFKEDLKLLEVFVYAHDEVEKFSSQWPQDTPSLLHTVLKATSS